MGRRKKYFTPEDYKAAKIMYRKTWRAKHPYVPTGNHVGRPRKYPKKVNANTLETPKRYTGITIKSILKPYTWLTTAEKQELEPIVKHEWVNFRNREYQKQHKDTINKWRKDVWRKTEKFKQWYNSAENKASIKRRTAEAAQKRKLDRILHPENHTQKTGKSEDIIYALLQEKYKNTKIFRQYRINDGITPLYLDFYIPSLRLAIEYNGEQHYRQATWWHWTKEDFANQVNRDTRKHLFCIEYNISLVDINGIQYNYDKIRRKKFKATLDNLLRGI